MAKQQIYDQETVPTGQLEADATPQAFGSQVGGALEDVSQGLEQVSQTANEIAQKRNQLWAEKQLADQQRFFIQKLNQDRTDGINAGQGGVAPGYTGQINEDLGTALQNLQKQAPDNATRNYLTQRFLSLGTDIFNRASDFEAHGNLMRGPLNYTGAVGDALAVGGAGAWGAADQIIKGVNSAAEGTMPSGQVQALKNTTSQKVDQAKTDYVLSTQGPLATADGIEQGKIGTTLSPEIKSGTVTNLQQVGQVNSAVTLNQAQTALQTAVSAVQNGDDSAPDKIAQARALFLSAHAGMDKNPQLRARAVSQAGDLFDASIAQAQTRFDITATMMAMPVAQQQQWAQEKLSELGGLDADGKGTPQAIALADVSGKLLKQAQTDSVAYVLNNPVLRKQYNTALQSNDPTQIQNATAQIIAAQKQAGLAPRVFTVAQATSQAANIRNMLQGAPVAMPDGTTKTYGPQDAINAIHGMSQTYGSENAGQVFRDLATLPPEGQRLGIEAQYIASLSPGSPYATNLAAVLNTSKEYLASQTTGSEKEITDSLNNDPTLGMWKQSIAPQDFNFSAQTQQMLTRQAQYLLGSGQAKTPQDAVTSAIKGTLGSIYNIKNGLLIPKVTDGGTFRSDSDFSEIQSGLDAMKMARLASMAPDNIQAYERILDKQSPDQRDKLSLNAAQNDLIRNTQWVTTPDGNGARLAFGYNVGGTFIRSGDVTMPNGQPVEVNYEDAQDFGKGVTYKTELLTKSTGVTMSHGYGVSDGASASPGTLISPGGYYSESKTPVYPPLENYLRAVPGAPATQAKPSTPTPQANWHPVGKTTHYGYADDPTPDKYTRQGLGSYGRLMPGALALTASQRLKLQAKPGDIIEMQDEAGNLHRGYYADNAPEADDRIDIYNPNGSEKAGAPFNAVKARNLGGGRI